MMEMEAAGPTQTGLQGQDCPVESEHQEEFAGRVIEELIGVGGQQLPQLVVGGIGVHLEPQVAGKFFFVPYGIVNFWRRPRRPLAETNPVLVQDRKGVMGAT